jgi:IS5 family transposase
MSGSVRSIPTNRVNPPLATRLMAGLSILKHTHNLSDEDLCARWIENPYYQLFCGEEFFVHKLPFDRSSLTRWRQRMGEEKLVAVIQESPSAATRTGAAKPPDLTKGSSTRPCSEGRGVSHRREAHAPGARASGALAKKHGVPLRQSYVRWASEH